MSSSSGVNDSSGNTAPLFVHLSTLHCACDSLCIPCFYKIFPNGSTAMFNNTSTTPVELSDTVLKLPANVRPENCPRAKAYTNASTAPHSRNTNTTTSLYQGLYHSNTEKILIVGDGDLSFALSIATYLQQQYGSARKLIATTHESYDSVCTTYTDGLKHITTLQSLGAKVYHEVDATNLSAFHVIDDQTFDYILWNFPCIRVEKGADGQVSELDQNIQLLQRFFQNAHHYLVDKVGEVHVAHKTIEPFSWWKIADIAAAQDFTCVGKVIFDRCNYPGYINRKVLDKKSFPSNDAQVFVFKPTKSLQVKINEEEVEDEEEDKKKKKKDKKHKKEKKEKKESPDVNVNSYDFFTKYQVRIASMEDESIQSQLMTAARSLIATSASKANQPSASKKRAYSVPYQPYAAPRPSFLQTQSVAKPVPSQTSNTNNVNKKMKFDE